MAAVGRLWQHYMEQYLVVERPIEWGGEKKAVVDNNSNELAGIGAQQHRNWQKAAGWSIDCNRNRLVFAMVRMGGWKEARVFYSLG